MRCDHAYLHRVDGWLIGICVWILCAYLQLLVSPWSHQIIQHEATMKRAWYGVSQRIPSKEDEEVVHRKMEEILDRRRKQVGMCQM
jgi:hypothetical protein